MLILILMVIFRLQKKMIYYMDMFKIMKMVL
nr:MAG TPA: hypothetical protein [Caudoviricetes sp.]